MPFNVQPSIFGSFPLSFFGRVVSQFLDKVVAVLSSKHTQKLIINAVVFLTIFFVLLGSAIILYTIFYHVYIPQVSIERDVWFDYRYRFKSYLSLCFCRLSP